MTTTGVQRINISIAVHFHSSILIPPIRYSIIYSSELKEKSLEKKLRKIPYFPFLMKFDDIRDDMVQMIYTYIRIYMYIKRHIPRRGSPALPNF